MVSKCQDPVVVQVTVNNNTLRLTDSTEVSFNSGYAAKVSIQRDDNNLFFNVSKFLRGPMHT